MSKMFISYQGLSDLQKFYIDENIHPQIASYEGRYIVDCLSDSYSYIHNNHTNYMVFHYSGLGNLPTTVFDTGVAGFYIEIDRNMYDTSSGINFLYYKWSYGETFAVDDKVFDTTEAYGDYTYTGIAYVNGGVVSVFCSGVNTINDRLRGKIIFCTSGLADGSIPYNAAVIGTSGLSPYADEGDYEKVYEIMFGILIDLPDGKLVPSRNYTDKWLGQKLIYKPFGQPVNVGALGAGRKRSQTIEFDKCTESQWLLIRDIFKYSRGSYPLIYLDNINDTTTWVRGFASRMTVEEPGHKGYYNIRLELEEY